MEADQASGSGGGRGCELRKVEGAAGIFLLNGVRVGTGSIVAAGAVCKEGMQIPPNSMVMGVPGKVVRETTTLERERIRDTVESYLKLQTEHRAGAHPRVQG